MQLLINQLINMFQHYQHSSTILVEMQIGVVLPFALYVK